jgi:very-short-patch-repair endonuclease
MPHRRTTPHIFLNAQELRRNLTEVEAFLWNRLRAHRLDGIHFRRQHAIGRYVADFCAPLVKLIVEVDGSHHLDQTEYDLQRTTYFEAQGYRVLRFWNHEVMNQIEVVLDVIAYEARREPPPGLPHF